MASRGVAVVIAVAAAAVGAAVWFATRPADDGGSGAAEVGNVPAQGTADGPAVAKSGKRERLPRHGEGIVVGSVRVFGSDEPVGGTAVTLTAGDVVLETTTQADGTFALASVPKAAEWTLRVGGVQGLGDAELAGVEVVDRRVTDVGVVYLAPGFAVLGVVEDEHGAPVPGASVVALKPRETGRGLDVISMVRELGSEIPAAKSTESGTDGRFRLTGLPPGAYTVVARKSGFATGVQRHVLFAPGGEAQTVRLVLGKGHRLEGRVTRKGGGPVAGLSVVAFTTDAMQETFDLQMPDKAIARTDEKGAFVFDSLGAAKWNIGVAPDGEGLAFDEDVRVPQQSFVELSLEGGATLSGCVTDAAGAPIAGAEVVAGSQKSVGAVETGADGRYAIRGLRPGPAEMFMVRARGYCPHPSDGMFAFMDPSRQLVLEAGANTRDVQLLAGGRVKGLVLEEGTTTPVAGVTVSVMSPSLFMAGSPVATTDAEGRFEIVGVPVGESIVTAKKTGWCQPGADEAQKGLMESAMNFAMGSRADASAKPDPGSGLTVVIAKHGDVAQRTLRLVRSVVMTGRVLAPDGTPLAGAEVAARPEKSDAEFLPSVMNEMMGGGVDKRLTDRDGRFEVTSPVVAGTVRLVAKARGLLDARSEPIEIAVGVAPLATELRMAAGGRVEGRVVSAAGAEIADAEVSWDPEEEEEHHVFRRGDGGRAVTGADGVFRFDTVQPGKVTVRVRHPQFVAAAKEHVVVVESQTAKADFSLEPGKSIKGRIVRSDGKTFAGHAWLDVEPEGGLSEEFESPEHEVSADGIFHVDGLRDGRYRITAHVMWRQENQGGGAMLFNGNVASEPVVAAAGDSDVVIRVDPGVAIAGVVRLAGGGPVAGAQVTAWRMKTSEHERDDGYHGGATGSDGSFRIDGLRPGRYVVTVGVGTAFLTGEKAANVRPRRVADVNAGTEDLSIEVEPGLVIAGTVRLPDGKPAKDGEVTAGRDAPRETEDDAAEQAGHELSDVPSGNVLADGRFEVLGLEPGTYRVTIVVEGYPAATLTAEAGAKDLAVQLVRGGTVKGRVLLPDGKPAKGASVTIEDDADDETARGAECESDDQGNFELKGVLAGEHRVAADWSDEADDDVWFEGEALGVDVKADQTVEGVEIRLKKSE